MPVVAWELKASHQRCSRPVFLLTMPRRLLRLHSSRLPKTDDNTAPRSLPWLHLSVSAHSSTVPLQQCEFVWSVVSRRTQHRLTRVLG